jgi:photosystem II stability/assembly factor-like uncharacterized protein
MKRLLSFFAIVVLLRAHCLQAQWIQTNGPDGNVTTCFAVNGTNLFAGTTNRGVFVSTDNGTNWTQLNVGLQMGLYFYVNALVVSGSNLFVGTFSDVFRSTDNGASWTDVSAGIPIAVIKSFAVKDSNLFAGTDFSLYLSTNNGTNWTEVNTGLPSGAQALAVKGTNLFAGTLYGVFLSNNNGTSWTPVNDDLTYMAIRAFTVNGSNLFAGTDGGVFLSTNNGSSWTAVNNGLTDTHIHSFAVNDSNIFVGTQGGVFFSSNHGASWTGANTGLRYSDVWSLVVHGSNLFAGTSGGGVWRRPLSEMVTGVEDNFSQTPGDFALEQNYPNPFNPQTTIRYQLPKITQVVLKIYNTSGQEVRTLVNERQTAGSKLVVWDGRDQLGKEVSSGVYLYRLQTGESVQSRKMSLVR